MKLLLLLIVLAGVIAAEDGRDAWLRYARVQHARRFHARLPSHITVLNSTKISPVKTAGDELRKGILGIFGKDCTPGHKAEKHGASVVVGTIEQYQAAFGRMHHPPQIESDGFYLDTTRSRSVLIIGKNERGALYGAFEYLSMLAQVDFRRVAHVSNPSAPIRWVNQWDNLDGTIERGYAGASIFFANGAVVEDLTRASQYARILASIGINAVVVNNVNSDANLLTPQNIGGLGRIADAFRPYGVQLSVTPLFSSPSDGVGGREKLNTYDPLDSGVVSWWQDVTDEIYNRIPDFAGYLIKANSEGQPGPLHYNRTLAEGANLFAKAVQSYGGVVMFRAFIYDSYNKKNWRDDRALASNEHVQPLDGEFDDNVVVQIKYGPLDFQVREPTAPLFGNLPKSNTAIELQVSQEYLGQQCHLVYEPPLWKTVLDFDLRADGKQSLTKDIVTGKRFNRPLGGFAAVVNVGTNSTWLGSHLAMSNLYAFGKLAWNPSEEPRDMIRHWTRLTFGLDEQVTDTIADMSMKSWPAYEKYTGNLGMQTLVAIYTHFGPDPHDQDFSGAGRWFRADSFSIGMDRTVWNGTRFAGQYHPEVAKMYEDVATTPDDLLLWFHHVNYTHVLKSGETVIQHIYNAHYDGAAQVQSFLPMWKTLRNKIDAERYTEMLFRLYFQAGHALVWRDAITTYFNSVSGVADESHRLDHHPYRIEAENMQLKGFKTHKVSVFETASNSTCIITTSSNPGTASTTIPFESGVYDVAVNYFDKYGGEAGYELFINNQLLGKWKANARQWVDGQEAPSVLGHDLSRFLDGHSASRTVFHDVAIRKGDMLKIVGTPNGEEPAPVDYVSLLPRGHVD